MFSWSDEYGDSRKEGRGWGSVDSMGEAERDAEELGDDEDMASG